ncbi:glucokinase [Piscinibacter sakaiensis]|uniref:Glucokinase n=1 Tax=Piscinibacter sakaiensis TaxID=1547922 RepID=A0A0K8P322_PISS1|nr:glucokinase [Piscinibacter sakaiensis]GAP37041.1 glucokinase [Piscinibacter sakaiensis]
MSGTPAGLRLLADIGGTNARLALQAGAGAPITDERVLRCADFDGVGPLLAHYLHERGAGRPVACAIGIASPVSGDRVAMTNLPWRFSIAGLQAELGLQRLRVVNDFTALALALPVLAADELEAVGGGAPVEGAAWGLVGPGTGLGVGGLLPAPGGGWSPIAGEGGHVTLAGADDREDAVLRELRRAFGHASAERALSGPGLANLHRASLRVDGLPGAEADEAGDPAAVVAGAQAGDAACGRSVDLFLALLGSVAGNLALTLGAQRGVFIGGGIVPRLGDRIHRSAFRERFEAKGRYRGYLAAIPTWVIRSASPPALRGAAQALELPG